MQFILMILGLALLGLMVAFGVYLLWRAFGMFAEVVKGNLRKPDPKLALLALGGGVAICLLSWGLVEVVKNVEISDQRYKELAAETHPQDINFLIQQAMEDGKITLGEWKEIEKAKNNRPSEEIQQIKEQLTNGLDVGE